MVWKYLFGNEEQEGNTAVNLKNPPKGEVKGAATSVLDGLITPTKSGDLDDVPKPPKKDSSPLGSMIADDKAEKKEDDNPMRKNFWEEPESKAPTLNTDLIASREKEVTPHDLRKGETMDFSLLKDTDTDSKPEPKHEEKMEAKPIAIHEDAKEPTKMADMPTFGGTTSSQISDIKDQIESRKSEEQKALTKLEDDLKKIQDQISSRKAAIAELDQLQPKIADAQKHLEEIEAEQARIKKEQEDAANALAELKKKVTGSANSF